jgi:hypothetical protein
MIKMVKINSSRNPSAALLAIYGVCLLLLSGCDQVKFKPVHGNPPPTKNAQPSVVVVNTPRTDSTGKTTKNRTPNRRVSTRQDDGDQDDLPEFDTTSQFSFDVSNFGASTFSSRGSGAHTSNHPVFGKGEAIKLVSKLIAESMDYAPTLVVWLLDQSDSARANIMDLGQQLSSPYAALTNGQPEDSDRLLTAVVSYGEKVEFTVDPPTADAARVTAAMSGLKEDKSGKEMTFSAVKAALDKYLPYRTKQRREVIFIIVTDEAGDDDEMVDAVIILLQRHAIPIYVLGVAAPFGRSAGMAQSVEAAIDDRSSGTRRPIRQGPESRQAERIHLGFWGGATDLELLDSGFGPFALQRLATTSGGRFLPIRSAGAYGLQWPSPGVPRFDPQKMRRYAPDNTTREEYQKILDGNAACRALTDAARLSEVKLTVFLEQEFVKRSEAQLTTLLAKAQQVTAKLEPAIELLHETLKQGVKDREKLTSPRWQAGYDLALGRASAARARIEGYNEMLAAVKRGKKFENETSNTWVLMPSDTIEASTALRRLLADAKKYLQRVVDEHPGTPWALVAERELMMPIGWKWTER